MQRDVAALERLHRPGRIPAEFLFGFFEHPARIIFFAEWNDSFAAEVTVFAGGALHEAPMERVAGELRDRPAEQKGREGGPLRVRGVGAQRTAGAPGAVAMSPPCVIGERNVFPAELQRAARATHLIESRDVLHDFAAALAQIVFLFVRIHRGGPFDVEPQRRRIVIKLNTESAQSLQRLDRERADFHFIDSWTQRSRGAEVVLPAFMPDGRESVLNIFVGILPDAETENRILVANIIDADIDALGPFWI